MSEERIATIVDKEDKIQHKEGYITFLDILGWKEIWKDKNEDEIE